MLKGLCMLCTTYFVSQWGLGKHTWRLKVISERGTLKDMQEVAWYGMLHPSCVQRGKCYWIPRYTLYTLLRSSNKYICILIVKNKQEKHTRTHSQATTRCLGILMLTQLFQQDSRGIFFIHWLKSHFHVRSQCLVLLAYLSSITREQKSFELIQILMRSQNYIQT